MERKAQFLMQDPIICHCEGRSDEAIPETLGIASPAFQRGRNDSPRTCPARAHSRAPLSRGTRDWRNHQGEPHHFIESSRPCVDLSESYCLKYFYEDHR